MPKNRVKGNFISVFLTLLVLVMVIFSGPVHAIDVNFQDLPEEIDVSNSLPITFSLEVQINDGEFLPLINTDVRFSVGSEEASCRINDDNSVDGCNFLSVASRTIDGLDSRKDYGYGYGYGYLTNNLGWQDFGYGYGYGYGERGVLGSGSGKIVYNLVVNPNLLPNGFIDKNVQVEAEVTGGSEDNKAVFRGKGEFLVKKSVKSDSESVADAKAALIFDKIKGANTLEEEITSNLNLISLISDNVKISWSSSDNNALNPFSGIVSRPKNGEGNKLITLTATISKGAESDTKTFELIILQETKSDEQAVLEAINSITLSSILNGQSDNSVTNNLNLPTSGSDNTKISWSSSNNNIIEKSGSVSRPALDTQIDLTATVSKGTALQAKAFTLTVLGTTDLDELALAGAKLALTEIKILNGNVEKDKIIGDVKLPTSLENHPGISISWSSSNTSVIAVNGSVARDINEDKEVSLTATLTKSSASATKDFILKVKKQIAPATIVGGTVEVDSGVDEILIDNTNAASLQTVSVPASISEDQAVTLNLNSLVDQSKKELTTANTLTLTRATSSVSYSVEIPTGTKITGEADWNGLITLPTVKAAPSATITGTAQVTIEVGSSTVKLTFDKATKLTIPGQAGQNAGYVLNGVFTAINACTSGEIADPNSLPAGGDCFTTSGNDLIIWTKHFTEFVSYTPSSESSSGGGGSDTTPNPPAPRTGTGLVGARATEQTTAAETPSQSGQTGTTETKEGEGIGGITGAVVGGGRTSKILMGVVITLAAIGLIFQFFGKKIRFKRNGIF